MGRKKVAVTLTLMSGKEPWIHVQHATGWFRVPADVSLLLVHQGVIEGWNQERRQAPRAPTWIRIRAEELEELRRRR